MNRHNPLALIAIVGVFLAGGVDTAAAQATSTSSGHAYPTRPVRLIVAYPPSGGGDTVARIVGQKLTEAWGQQVVVDNRPGGGANIGAELAAHAAPDGYTLFMPALAHTVNASLYPKLGYDMRRDFAYVGAPALTDLLSGQVHSAFSNMIPTMPHTRSGRLRALAVSSAKRSPAAPEIPTIAESGVPGFEAGSWFGFAVLAQTPRPIIAKINAEVNRILALPDLRSRLSAEGAELIGGTPEAFTAYVHSEIDKWAKVVKLAKLSVD